MLILRNQVNSTFMYDRAQVCLITTPKQCSHQARLFTEPDNFRWLEPVFPETAAMEAKRGKTGTHGCFYQRDLNDFTLSKTREGWFQLWILVLWSQRRFLVINLKRSLIPEELLRMFPEHLSRFLTLQTQTLLVFTWTWRSPSQRIAFCITHSQTGCTMEPTGNLGHPITLGGSTVQPVHVEC